MTIRTITGALRAIRKAATAADLNSLAARLGAVAWNDGGAIAGALDDRRVALLTAAHERVERARRDDDVALDDCLMTAEDSPDLARLRERSLDTASAVEQAEAELAEVERELADGGGIAGHGARR